MEIEVDALQVLPESESGAALLKCSVSCQETCAVTCFVTN